jgi:glycosyltransferase involved in cell wall biosynthesis
MSKKNKDLLILIPAFNEEKTINKMIKEVKTYGKVLVIDDGSNDKTRNIALKSGAIVLRHKKNLGYNTAINSGIKYFLKKKFDKIITIDADGQLPGKYIYIIKKKFDLKTDVVCGIRTEVSRFGEKIFLFISKIIWGLKDPLCGTKGFSYNFVKKYYMKPNFDSINTELLIRAKKNKIDIKEIMIKNKFRKDQSRFGEGLKVNLFIVLTLFKCILFIN